MIVPFKSLYSYYTFSTFLSFPDYLGLASRDPASLFRSCLLLLMTNPTMGIMILQHMDAWYVSQKDK